MSTGETVRTAELPSSPESLDAVHRAFATLWDGRPPKDAPLFETAVIEIVANVIRHSGAPTFALELSNGEEAVVAIVEDGGVEVADLISGATIADPLAETGRGIALALAAADEVRYERVNDRNQWTVLRRR